MIKFLKKHGCVVLKTTPGPGIPKGFPDLVCFARDGGFYFCLECKASRTSEHQPGQDMWIERLNAMSYAKFIWPGKRWEETAKELEEMLK